MGIFWELISHELSLCSIRFDINERVLDMGPSSGRDNYAGQVEYLPKLAKRRRAKLAEICLSHSSLAFLLLLPVSYQYHSTETRHFHLSSLCAAAS